MKMSRKTKRLVLRTILVCAGLYIAFTFGVKLTDWATGLIRTAHRANISRKTDVKAFAFELPQAYDVHGIDISKHQKSIDWLQVSKSEWKGKKLSFVFREPNGSDQEAIAAIIPNDPLEALLQLISRCVIQVDGASAVSTGRW